MKTSFIVLSLVLLCAVVCSAQNGRRRRPSPNRDGDQQYTRDPDHTHPPRPEDHTRGTADADYTRPTRGTGNGGRPGRPEGHPQKPNRGKREVESDTDSDSVDKEHTRPPRGSNSGSTRPAPSTDDGQTRGPRPRQPGNGGRPQRRLLSIFNDN